MKLEKLERVKALRISAAEIGDFHDHFREKYGSDHRYDKKGFGFGNRENLVAFKISAPFYSYAGTYGNSSVYRVLGDRHREIVEAAFLKALNHHQRELFQTAARFMREEAASLTAEAQKEIEELNQLLAEARADLVQENCEAPQP